VNNNTEPRSESPTIAMCNGPLQENYKLQLGDMSDSLAPVTVDVGGLEVSVNNNVQANKWRFTT
jgi:hypothetical protein